MDTQKVDMFMITTVTLKDPAVLLIVSMLAGIFGIDRFMLGDIRLGVLKLVTLGCFGILAIVDWFTISDRTKDANFNDFMMLLLEIE